MSSRPSSRVSVTPEACDTARHGTGCVALVYGCHSRRTSAASSLSVASELSRSALAPAVASMRALRYGHDRLRSACVLSVRRVLQQGGGRASQRAV